MKTGNGCSQAGINSTVGIYVLHALFLACVGKKLEQIMVPEGKVHRTQIANTWMDRISK